jgi:tetratricopeptide (TPR) repeat protein
MSEVLFGARATQTLVGRKKALTEIHQAVCQAGTEFRLVLLTAQGGLGKTRLLRELLWHCGLPDDLDPRPPATGDDDWTIKAALRISQLLDFMDTRLHNRAEFLRAARDAFSRPTDDPFSTYDVCYSDLRKKMNAMESYSLVREARERAEQAFDEDYRHLTRPDGGQRLVWILDTAEQLVGYFGGKLVEYDLLRPEDLSAQTEGWLLDFIQQRPPNTTILLAGRGQEGARFFNYLRHLFSEDATHLLEVDLGSFDPKATQDYLEALLADWRDDPTYEDAREYLAEFLGSSEASERSAVLHLYTDGLPIRLALYADLLIESAREPEPLQDTLADAKARVERDGLGQVQFEVEGKFVDLIFDNPGSLRVQILLHLVRARRGLTPHELHFALDSRPDDSAQTWDENKERLAEIEQATVSLRHLSFVKRGPDGRTTLQDEFYRIYDEHMRRSDQVGETARRRTLYEKTCDLTERDLKKKRAELREWRLGRRETLSWEPPVRALQIRYRELAEEDEEHYNLLREEIMVLELTRLYYILLIDPRVGLNDIRYSPREQWQLAQRETVDTLIQVEMRRAIFDKSLRYFIDLPAREVERARGETAWDVLERVLEQKDAAAWIARLFFRGEYKRAIALADALAAKAEEWGPAWQHTFTRSEQRIWREAARIYLGEQVEVAVQVLETITQDLSSLLSPEGIPERGENTFRAPGQPPHPAALSLEIALGTAYNFAGYGYVVQGQFRRAVERYAQALRHFRAAKALVSASMTQTNLARALSELGRARRAERVCRDALAIREQLGEPSHIATTHNTLALIFNDAGRPEEAWSEAVLALIEFRQLGQARGIGLALLQLGEALRRLAVTPSPPDPPSALQEASEHALREALDIFTRDPYANAERLRRIEAELEFGCLYRDRVKFTPAGMVERRETRANNALRHLQAAVDLAEQQKNYRLRIDAQVNIGWLYYYWEKAGEANRVLDTALAWTPPGYTLRPGQAPPKPADPNLPDSFYFQQLSKLHTLRGRLHIERAQARIAALAEGTPDQSKAELVADAQVRQYMEQAAGAFVLAAGYAQLYAPRGVSIPIVFDILYEYLKTFNVIEMQTFFGLVRREQKRYQVALIEAENLADVEQFLLECFGDYFVGDEVPA